MSSFFSANQYEHVFWPHRLGNYEIPHRYKERPSPHPGFTRVLSNPIGYLLPGVPRSGRNPWGDFVGTWDLPNKLPGPRVYVPTARRFDVWDKMRREADELNTTIYGMTKNGRRNARLESVGFKITKPSKLGSMSPAHGDPCKDVITKVPKEPVEKFDLNTDEIPEQPEVPVEKQANLLPGQPELVERRSGSANKEPDVAYICQRTSSDRTPPRPQYPHDPEAMHRSESVAKKFSPPPFDDEGLTKDQKDLIRRQCEPCPPDTNRQNVIPPCETTEQANRRLCAAHMAIFHPPKCLTPQCRIPEADRADAITNMFSDDMCRRSPFPRRHDPMRKVCGSQAPSPGQPCQGFAPCLVQLPEDICPIDPCPRMGLDSWCAYEASNRPSPPTVKKIPTPPCKLPSPPALAPKSPNMAVEAEYERVCKRSPIAMISPKLTEGLCTSDGSPCRYPPRDFNEVPGSHDLAPCSRTDYRYSEPAVCPQSYHEEDTAQFLTGPMILETPKPKEQDNNCPLFL